MKYSYSCHYTLVLKCTGFWTFVSMHVLGRVCLAPPNGYSCLFGSNTGKNSDGRILRHRPNPLEDLENGRQSKEILIHCRNNVRPEFLLKNSNLTLYLLIT